MFLEETLGSIGITEAQTANFLLVMTAFAADTRQLAEQRGATPDENVRLTRISSLSRVTDRDTLLANVAALSASAMGFYTPGNWSRFGDDKGEAWEQRKQQLVKVCEAVHRSRTPDLTEVRTGYGN